MPPTSEPDRDEQPVRRDGERVPDPEPVEDGPADGARIEEQHRATSLPAVPGTRPLRQARLTARAATARDRAPNRNPLATSDG